MPIYIFGCPVCLHSKEVLQNFEAPAPTCDRRRPLAGQSECFGREMIRMPTSAAVKINGFSSRTGYSTDRTMTGPTMEGIKTSVTGSPEAWDSLT